MFQIVQESETAYTIRNGKQRLFVECHSPLDVPNIAHYFPLNDEKWKPVWLYGTDEKTTYHCVMHDLKLAEYYCKKLDFYYSLVEEAIGAVGTHEVVKDMA